MLSYQHGYHAGNVADVLKHLCLQWSLEHLLTKPGGWTYFDTHAGEGLYVLDRGPAAESREWSDGVARLWTKRTEAPAAVSGYLSVIEQHNPAGHLSRYPGSPAFARAAQRPQDALVLCELHPQALSVLQAGFSAQPGVHVHARDGFEGIQALLPPRSGRGLVLLDPSYELKADYQRIPDWVSKALQRWRQGVFLIWYPVLAHGAQRAMLSALRQTRVGRSPVEWLQIELQMQAPLVSHRRGTVLGMQACGVVVINPPWTLSQRLAEAQGWLSETLQAQFRLEHSPAPH